MLELFCDEVLIVNEQGVKFIAHQLWLLVKWYRLGRILAGENVGFSDGCPAEKHFVVLLVLFCESLEVKVPVCQVHYIMESFLAYGGEVFRRLKLSFIDNEVHHDFVLVLVHEFALVDSVD